MFSHWTILKNPPASEKNLHRTKHVANVDKNVMKILDEDGLLTNLFMLQR
jgi:hypothetical protein